MLHQRAYIAGVALAIRKENNRKGNNAFRDKRTAADSCFRHSINLTIKAQLPGPETACPPEQKEGKSARSQRFLGCRLSTAGSRALDYCSGHL